MNYDIISDPTLNPAKEFNVVESDCASCTPHTRMEVIPGGVTCTFVSLCPGVPIQRIPYEALGPCATPLPQNQKLCRIPYQTTPCINVLRPPPPCAAPIPEPCPQLRQYRITGSQCTNTQNLTIEQQINMKQQELQALENIIRQEQRRTCFAPQEHKFHCNKQISTSELGCTHTVCPTTRCEFQKRVSFCEPKQENCTSEPQMSCPLAAITPCPLTSIAPCNLSKCQCRMHRKIIFEPKETCTNSCPPSTNPCSPSTSNSCPPNNPCPPSTTNNPCPPSTTNNPCPPSTTNNPCLHSNPCPPNNPCPPSNPCSSNNPCPYSNSCPPTRPCTPPPEPKCCNEEKQSNPKKICFCEEMANRKHKHSHKRRSCNCANKRTSTSCLKNNPVITVRKKKCCYKCGYEWS